MRNLITYEEIGQRARPCTTDRDMAEAMIAEAQRVDLKPRLGDALYIELIKGQPEERFTVLLEGGTWECGGKTVGLLTGIKTALAYYALARIIRDGNIQASAYGAVLKDDQNSQDPEKTERQRQYRELFAQADAYMTEALGYIAANRDKFPEFAVCRRNMRSNRMTIRVIGK